MIDGKFTIVREDTTYPDKEYFLEKVAYLRDKYGYTEYKGESIEFHASGMVTFPLIGTKAEIEDKLAFDPTREKRKVLYPEVLELFKDYTVFIGGTSSFVFPFKSVGTCRICTFQKRSNVCKSCKRNSESTEGSRRK